MKTMFLLLFFTIAAFGGEKEGVLSDSAITTKVVEFTNQGRHVRIEKTFRGQEKIMSVMTYSNVTTRALLLHGDLKYIEADDDGDGHFESVMLPGRGADDFEVFRRRKDGALEPYPETEYLALRAKAAKAAEALQEALREAEREFEPNAPAKGSQPIRSETNTTSSAAGSRR